MKHSILILNILSELILICGDLDLLPLPSNAKMILRILGLYVGIIILSQFQIPLPEALPLFSHVTPLIQPYHDVILPLACGALLHAGL